MERECRFDVIRGLALLMIFVDHCEYVAGVAIFSKWTLRPWYWCDAAEVFVFLSGLVCGTSYLRVLERDGWIACQWKGLKRAAQLYLTNLGCLALVVCTALGAGPPAHAQYESLQYAGLHHGPESIAWASTFMLFQPLGLDMLTMYIQFVVTLPLVLACWRRWPLATKLLCLEVYLAAQCFVCWNLPRWPTDVYAPLGCGRQFQHVAWNCLFVLGAFVAVEPVRVPRSTLLVRGLFAASTAAVLVLTATSVPWLVGRFPWLGILRTWRFDELASKVTLGPVRLVAFLMLAFVVSGVFTEDRCRRWRPVLSPFSLLGRNSLLVYAMEIVLTHFTWCWIEWTPFGTDRFGIVAYEAMCVAIMLVVAFWRERSSGLRPLPANGPH
jgi:hypothetical protein